jgi:2,3-bisphosphoglycerate-independent phosphoglycerate mutase
MPRLVARALLVFVDGIGMGMPGAQNPFDGAPIRVLAPLGGRHEPPRGIAMGTLDASLGYPGLPQSATGQATLFSGQDAMGIVGGHAPAFPSAKLAAFLATENIFAKGRTRGLTAGFLNGFDDARAERAGRIVRGEEPRARSFPVSASTICGVASGGTLRRSEDVRRGAAATFDLTGEIVRGFGYDAPHRTPEGAARAVLAGSLELDLSYFEIFLTDKAGHSQDMAFARHEIARTERFLEEIFASAADDTLVVVTSDHGNLEDLGTGSHTHARVPLLAKGPTADALIARAQDLRDVGPHLLAVLGADA